MSSKTASAAHSTRRGFTITELLVAMALIVFIMAVLSQSFVAGLQVFRNLKGTGDLNENLRASAVNLRRDILETNALALDFVREGLSAGVDLAEATELHARYERICSSAIDLEPQLRALEPKTTNPTALRILRRALQDLESIKNGAATMVRIIELFF